MGIANSFKIPKVVPFAFFLTEKFIDADGKASENLKTVRFGYFEIGSQIFICEAQPSKKLLSEVFLFQKAIRYLINYTDEVILVTDVGSEINLDPNDRKYLGRAKPRNVVESSNADTSIFLKASAAKDKSSAHSSRLISSHQNQQEFEREHAIGFIESTFQDSKSDSNKKGKHNSFMDTGYPAIKNSTTKSDWAEWSLNSLAEQSKNGKEKFGASKRREIEAEPDQRKEYSNSSHETKETVNHGKKARVDNYREKEQYKSPNRYIPDYDDHRSKTPVSVRQSSNSNVFFTEDNSYDKRGKSSAPNTGGKHNPSAKSSSRQESDYYDNDNRRKSLGTDLPDKKPSSSRNNVRRSSGSAAKTTDESRYVPSYSKRQEYSPPPRQRTPSPPHRKSSPPPPLPTRQPKEAPKVLYSSERKETARKHVRYEPPPKEEYVREDSPELETEENEYIPVEEIMDSESEELQVISSSDEDQIEEKAINHFVRLQGLLRKVYGNVRTTPTVNFNARRIISQVDGSEQDLIAVSWGTCLNFSCNEGLNDLMARCEDACRIAADTFEKELLRRKNANLNELATLVELLGNPCCVIKSAAEAAEQSSLVTPAELVNAPGNTWSINCQNEASKLKVSVIINNMVHGEATAAPSGNPSALMEKAVRKTLNLLFGFSAA